MQDIQNALDNMQSVMVDFSTFENKSEEEKKVIIRLFFENIKFIKDLVFQKRNEKDDDIIERQRFIKFLDSIPQNSKIKELIKKENELIYYLKEDILFLDSTFLTLGHLENVILSSEKEEKLQYDINILIDLLKKEGSIATEAEERKL